jgi:hypothetical protein
VVSIGFVGIRNGKAETMVLKWVITAKIMNTEPVLCPVDNHEQEIWQFWENVPFTLPIF